MSEPEQERIVLALTRSRINRGDLLRSYDDQSDENLIAEVGGARLDPRQVTVLSDLSKILRLMDTYLTGEGTSRQFVQEFTKHWLALADWGEDVALQKDLMQFNDFYRWVHLYSDVPEHRREEPLLFGDERLIELTKAAYAQLKQNWLRALVGETAWAAS